MINIDKNIFFREATARINSSLDIHTAIERCTQYIRQVMPVNGIILAIYESGLNALRIIHASMKGSESIHNLLTPLTEEQKQHLEKEQKTMELLRKRSTVFTEDDWDPMRELGRQILPQDEHLSNIHLVQQFLSIEDNRLAILVVISDRDTRFSETEIEMIYSLHDPFAMAVANALNYQEILKLKNILAEENRELRKELHISDERILGAEFGLKNVMEMVYQVTPLDSPVLLLGETGVGKDLIANTIHYSSPRKDGPFVKVNCGAIPDTLVDSELFGHEKGAFTGAVTQKKGRFERADNGTIFLDEVGELPLEVQVRLLRTLQTKEIERVGGTEPIRLDIRVIAATNKDLKEAVHLNRFRKDLWYRLNVFPILIPPLRERVIDIPALVQHFIEKKSKEMKKHEIPGLEAGSLDILASYDWPGNVRELENLVERALIIHKKGSISFRSILSGNSRLTAPAEISIEDESPMKLNDAIRMHIEHALKQAKGKINGPGGAAEILDVKPNTLRKKLIKLNIPFGRNAVY